MGVLAKLLAVLAATVYDQQMSTWSQSSSRLLLIMNISLRKRKLG